MSGLIRSLWKPRISRREFHFAGSDEQSIFQWFVIVSPPFLSSPSIQQTAGIERHIPQTPSRHVGSFVALFLLTPFEVRRCFVPTANPVITHPTIALIGWRRIPPAQPISCDASSAVPYGTRRPVCRCCSPEQRPGGCIRWHVSKCDGVFAAPFLPPVDSL